MRTGGTPVRASGLYHRGNPLPEFAVRGYDILSITMHVFRHKKNKRKKKKKTKKQKEK